MTALQRPFPNVSGRGQRWCAYRPSGNHGTYIGTFNTPEDAYLAVLEAQAANLEARAAGYRAQAAALRRENGEHHA